MPGYDAIVVPGGGVRPGGELPPWVTPRLDRALALAGPAWLLLLSAGTPHHPPPLDEHGFPWTEARAGARYLAARGADPARILLEESSFDTIGNAYFARTIHAAPAGFSRLLVVNSNFHMPRTEAIFRWIFALPGPGACSVSFECVPDTGAAPAALALRAIKERASLQEVERLAATLRTLPDLHRWIFTAHRAYAFPGERGDAPGDTPLYA